MSWTTPFVIYRLNDEGRLLEVSRPEDIKKAKYWLNYIAQEFDVLCKTPLHPKHSKSSSRPEYWSHKTIGGGTDMNEASWRAHAQRLQWDSLFPEPDIAGQGENSAKA